MIIYNYSRITYEYTTQEEADLDPIDGTPMMPAFSTSVEPPSTPQNRTAVFNPGSDTWSIFLDYRGTEFYFEDGSAGVVYELNENVPDGVSLSPPPENHWFYRIVNGEWVFRGIEDIKDIKIKELYLKTLMVIDKNLKMYSAGERETWMVMYDECVKYKDTGVIGRLMQLKISVDPEYNTADKLADMTTVEYMRYVEGKFNVESQRSQHKININNLTDPMEIIEYNSDVLYN